MSARGRLADFRRRMPSARIQVPVFVASVFGGPPAVRFGGRFLWIATSRGRDIVVGVLGHAVHGGGDGERIVWSRAESRRIISA
jgi:hypothetical protein